MGYIVASGRGTTGNSSSAGPFTAEPHKERRDFDDGANALWSLYGKEAQTHDEARFQSLAADMSGIVLFVRLYLNGRPRFIHVYFHRPAYFLLFSLTSSSAVFIIYNRTLHNNQHIISSNRSRCSPRSHRKSHLSPHRFPYHPLPHHLTQHSIHLSPTSE